MLDEHGNEIELKDDDEDNYQPGRFREDDYDRYQDVGSENEFADAGFTMKMNLISTWLIVMPLSFMAAFWWRWPVEAVVLVIQSDQIFKGLPTYLRFRKYQWMKKLTQDG